MRPERARAIYPRWGELKAGGMESSAAWAQASAEAAGAKPPSASASAWAGRPPCSPAAAAQWAMDYLEAADVQPAEAPSGAAWALLLLGRGDRAALVSAWRWALDRDKGGPAADERAPG